MSDRFRFHSLTLQSTPDATEAASTWLRDLGSHHGLSEEQLFHLDLCASELLANIVDYAYCGATGEIRLELLLDQGTAALTIIDAGPPFDLLEKAAPPLPSSLEAAPVGGLGIHLVRQFADEVHYARSEGYNRLTFRIGVSTPTRPQQEHPEQQESSRNNGITKQDLDFVSRTSLFRDVPYRDVVNILADCELRNCAAGEVLLRAGEHHCCVLLGIEGRLEVHLDAPDSQDYFELDPGECVGEMSVADGKPISAWVVAATPGRLLVIPGTVFLGKVLGVATIARNLIVVMSERMRRNSQQIVARLRAAMELESLQRELDVAREIQASMLPTAPLFPTQTGIEGRGFMRAARQVGGDFYDAFSIGEGRFFVAVGDVCNKGTPAALFMVRTLTLLRSEALRPLQDADQHLAILAARCNELLCESNAAQQFVTMFCAIVDLQRGQLHYINAGHNPPLLRLPGAEPVFVEGPRNPLAGLIPGIKYTGGRLDFPAGCLLLLYTDGVTEAEAADGTLFGDDALRLLLATDAAANAEGCVECVVAAVDAFAAGQLQSDDITLLAIRHA